VFVLLSLPTVTSCSHVVVATEIQLEESTSGCSSVVVGESAVSYFGLVCSLLVALITLTLGCMHRRGHLSTTPGSNSLHVNLSMAECFPKKSR